MTQETEVLAHLKRKSITQEQAIDNFRCFRLAAIINRLRGKGHKISTEMVGKRRYARYRLINK